MSGILSLPYRNDELGPDIRPVIRTKIATGYDAVRCTLNSSATLNRHRPSTGNPLTDCRRLYAQDARKRRKTSNDLTRCRDWRFRIHTRSIRLRLMLINRNCLTSCSHGVLGYA